MLAHYRIFCQMTYSWWIFIKKLLRIGYIPKILYWRDCGLLKYCISFSYIEGVANKFYLQINYKLYLRSKLEPLIQRTSHQKPANDIFKYQKKESYIHIHKILFFIFIWSKIIAHNFQGNLMLNNAKSYFLPKVKNA